MITRDVEVTAVADLALAPPRAALAATIDDKIHLLAVNVSVDDPTDLASSLRVVRVQEDTPDLDGRNVVLVADDGPQWFRLRSLTVRATAIGESDRSYRLVPRRIVAWDYGALRDAPAPTKPAAAQHPSLSDVDLEELDPMKSSNSLSAVSASRVMILGTRSRKGTPFAVPLWFVTHHGRIYAATGASSWTVRNVAATPEVAVLFGGERGRGSDRLLVRGRARAVLGAPPAAVLARMAWRYYLDPRFAAVELSHVKLWGRRMRYYSQSQAAHVVITPQSATGLVAPE